MKKLLITSRNHMDPSWLRCFTNHYTRNGEVIRPYSDIEEELISQHLDFMKKYPWKYGIEQSIVLRRFLERNPDRFEEVKKRIYEGKFELLGGGENVIDSNLVHGESLYRNHYYSIKYYERVFGCRPKYVDTPDIFGLSAQLPQIFRQFGYIATTQFERVFRDHRPVWRGLDGSMLALWNVHGVMSFFYPDCYKYTACHHCHGEGCEMCNGIGIDFSYDYSYHEKPRGDRDGLVYYAGPESSTEEFIEKFAASDDEANVIYVTSEETRHMDDYLDMLCGLCEKHGIELCPVTIHELMERSIPETLEALLNGTVTEDMIDDRIEGNPVATGCFTSRIEIKRLNRMLEQLALSTEVLAAIAYPAEEYPHKGFERIWNMLSFLQFHDCITCSHVDASYEELLQTCRDVYTACGRIRKYAMKTITAATAAKPREGWESVTVFNTTSEEWNDVPVKAVLRQRDVFENVELCDAEGKTLPVTELKITNNALDCGAEVGFIATIPAMSALTVYWRTAEPKAPELCEGDTIENEFFAVSPRGITDKLRSRPVMQGNAGGLELQHDWGHAWGRLRDIEWCHLVPDAEVTCEKGDGFGRLIFKGGYSDPEKNIASLRWTRTVTLYDGIDKVFWRNEIDWDGEDVCIRANFPLSIDHGDSAFYEIPYGMLERSDTIVPANFLGVEDEWPALNWFAAYDEKQDYSVILYNKGTPGSRIKDGNMQISLLRSPAHTGDSYDGARDRGHHVLEYALSVCDGKPDNADPTSFGTRYTSTLPSAATAYGKGEKLETADLLASVKTEGTTLQLTAVKRDADGRLILRISECYGKAAALTLPLPATEVDPLEEKELAPAAQTISFRPFEIKTLRI